VGDNVSFPHVVERVAYPWGQHRSTDPRTFVKNEQSKAPKPKRKEKKSVWKLVDHEAR
jgi:hypothetical protein